MESIWNAYAIADVDGLRRLLRSYRSLEALAASGDVASATIICDLNSAMQYTTHDAVRVISPRQYQVLRLFLIDGLEADAVADALGIDRRRVFYHVARGLKHMLRYLQDKQTATWFGQPWQYEYVRRNAHLPRKELAAQIGKSVSAVGKMLWKLRSEGHVIARSAGRRVAGPGPQIAARLAERRVSNADGRSVARSA